MKTQDLKSFADELAKNMKEELESIGHESQDTLVRISRSQAIALNSLFQLKAFVQSYSFKDAAEEINFFKEIKPQFLSQYNFQERLLFIRTKEPLGNKENLLAFYERELQHIQKFSRTNMEFHLYCLSGATHLDEHYFLRKPNTTNPHLDHQFTTGYDTLLSQFTANEWIKEYLLTAIRRANINESTALSWTGSKAALIELMYALQTVEVFNNGKADLKQIAISFENLFNISLGNYSRAFQEIRLRKSGRTNFLDQLKVKFIQRMDEMD